MRFRELGRFLQVAVLAWLLGGVPGSSAGAHPSLYFQAADLASIQARAQDDATNALGYDFASVFQEMRDRADGYRSSPCTYTVQIPNPDGSGSVEWSYTVSEEMPPPHPNNPRYPPWTALSRRIQRRLETLAFVYAVTGDETYLTNQDGYGALDLALAVSSWDQWTDPGYSCGGRTCLDTAHLTMGVALVYDLGFDAMSPTQRTRLRQALVDLGVVPLAADVAQANESGTASAWFNGYALRVTGLAVGAAAVAPEVGAQADDWLRLAGDSVRSFFDSQGSDGGTFEGQLYGSYAMDQLVIAAHVLAQQGVATDLFDHPWLATLSTFVASFLDSGNHRLANFGDSSEAAYWANTMFGLAARGDGLAQWYLLVTGHARPSSPLQFVWADPGLPPDPPEGSGSALFHDVGHAVLRAGFSGAPVVAVKSGPPEVSVGHNHYDQNSFIVSAYGEWIAADPGYRNYFNAAKRTYTTESVGHNTILVDKAVASDGSSVQGGQVSLTGGSLNYLLDGRGYAKVVGKANSAYEPGLLTRFGRRIFYAKPDLVLVFDNLAAPQAHEFSWLLHAPRGGAVRSGERGPSEMVLYGKLARLQAFLVASVALKTGYPKSFFHPGAEEYGPYAEWRTSAARAVRFVAALVPGSESHTSLANPGFEDGFASWTPRFQDGSHQVDETVARSGAKSGRISFDSSRTGYYYSEPISVLPSASIHAQVYVRAQATGTVRLQFYWMESGAYIEDPAGDAATLDAASAGDWTLLSLDGTVPDRGVDAVRLALVFSGTGTVWFDDAEVEATPSPQSTPLARAVALLDASGVPEGIVVEGPFGVEAAASVFGAGISGDVVLEPASGEIPAVSRLSSDGEIFCVGLTPAGELKRAYLQGGTYVALGDVRMASGSEWGSFEVAVERDATGCASLYLTQVPTLEAPPYRIRAQVAQVFLDGRRVPFVQEGDEVVFPEGSDLGPGCEWQEPGPDAGLDAAWPDGAVAREAGTGQDAGPETPEVRSSGCGCATGTGGLPALPALLLVVGAVALLRRRT